ncbi:acetylglutamate kinase [Shewanella maritima]|uniref:acetylglutamate kinase n=1 Tax=Shewanella maritima TaxID=2520507 RepID=UPI003735F16E
MKKPIVIKVGGALLQQAESLSSFMAAVKSMIDAGQPVVLVHGGGYLVEQQLQANSKQTIKLDGLRVTPEDQIDIIVGALAGTANKQIQAAAIAAGISAVGMSLSDANTVSAKVMKPELGLVGEVVANDDSYLQFIIAKGCLAVCSSIAIDEQGNCLNVNADQAAVAIAQLLQGGLVLLSDVPGVLDANKQLLTHLNESQIHALITQGVIEKGMKVKVEAALAVAQQSGVAVNIASWQDTIGLMGFANGGNLGTQIQP